MAATGPRATPGAVRAGHQALARDHLTIPTPARQQVHPCAGLVALPGDPVEHRATVRALALTAQPVLAARQDAKQLEGGLCQLVMAVAPALLTEPGIGPISAAQLLISWSHPGRFGSEAAAFAVLAGAAPVEAFSGQVVGYRLNRGGDRQLHSGLAHHRAAAPGPSRADQGLHQQWRPTEWCR